MKAIQPDEAEIMVIDAFLNEHWSKFCLAAEEFMTAEEIDLLFEKLSGNNDE